MTSLGDFAAPGVDGTDRDLSAYDGQVVLVVNTDDEQIAEFCDLTFGVTFPLFAKVDVNGPTAHPLWTWMKGEKGGVLGSRRIKWNFTKFLIGRDGQVLARYAPRTTPAAIAADIEAALGA